MRAIEAENEELRDVLPKSYQGFEKSTLLELLKTFNSIPMDIECDAFSKINEDGVVVTYSTVQYNMVFYPDRVRFAAVATAVSVAILTGQLELVGLAVP